MIIVDLLKALRAGEELANAETWKRAQARTSALVAIILALAGVARILGYEVRLDAGDAQNIALGIGSLLAAFGMFGNAVATVVSTKRIGLPARADSGTGTGSNGGGGGEQAASRPESFDADVFGTAGRGG